MTKYRRTVTRRENVPRNYFIVGTVFNIATHRRKQRCFVRPDKSIDVISIFTIRQHRNVHIIYIVIRVSRFVDIDDLGKSLIVALPTTIQNDYSYSTRYIIIGTGISRGVDLNRFS